MIRILIHTDTRYPVNRKIIRQAVSDIILKNKVKSDTEVSVAVVGERKMKVLSYKYLKDGRSHEVLAFALEDPSYARDGFLKAPDEILRLGDVVLCWPQVLALAAKDDVMVDDEIYFLTSHGVLHLLGKHHE